MKERAIIILLMGFLLLNAVYAENIPPQEQPQQLQENYIIQEINKHTDEKVKYGLDNMKSYGDSFLASAKSMLKQYTFYVAIFLSFGILFTEFLTSYLRLRREKNLLIVLNNDIIRIRENQDKIIQAMEKEGLL